MATIALFYAVGRWNAYSDALYYIKQNVALRPLQLKLYYLIVAASESFQTEGVATVSMTTPEVLKAACISFALSIPPASRRMSPSRFPSTTVALMAGTPLTTTIPSGSSPSSATSTMSPSSTWLLPAPTRCRTSTR